MRLYLLVRGPRACLGRRCVIGHFIRIPTPALTDHVNRFAEMESVVAITMLVSNYKITLKEEPRFANESLEQKKERLLKSISLLTLTCVFFFETP